MAQDAAESAGARWKSRYLGALDAHERLEREAGTRVGELGALIARLSRSLPAGGTGPLAKSLGSLADALKHRPLDPRLSREVSAASGRLLDVMEAHDRERAALTTALGEAAAQIESLCASRALKRRLKRFRASLRHRNPPAPSVLVGALAELQEAAVGATQAAAGHASQADPSPPPDLSPPRVPEPEPAPCAPPAAAAPPSPDWSAVRQVLVSLVSRVELPEQFQDQVQQVNASLEQELNADRLLEVLEGIRDLFDAALAALRGEFRGFLDSVDRRLDILLGALGQVREDGDAVRDLERGLASSVQASLAAMRDEAAAATELDQLKHSIDSHLECLVRSVQDFSVEGESLDKARDARLEAMARRLRDLESESREARGQLETQRRLALTDALTGLPNRKALDERLEEELAVARRHGTPLAVAMADIDHFKRVNDGYGHQAGDRALVLFARIVSRRIRQSDFCARYGGEEFLLLFPGTEAATAERVLEQVRAFVESCGFSYKGAPVPLTASFGVTELSSDDSAEGVVARADKALYAAKSGGRNQVRRG